MASPYRNLIEIPQAGALAFRHFFIPQETNNHHPHAIRPRALKIYSIALIAIKLALTGFLYVIYPNEAQFAQLTESKMFELTNIDRKEHGMPALALNQTLVKAARAKAQDMLAKDYFDHTSPDGKKFWQWIKESGYAYTTAGENLAMDFTTAESVDGALMASPTHRANILKSAYTEVGFAVVQGNLLGSTTTVLVEYFGNPVSKLAVAPKPAEQPAAPAPIKQNTVPAPAVAGATAPTFAATYVGRSNELLTLGSGESANVWIDYQNSGLTAWVSDGDDAVFLTADGDDAGHFAAADWISATQAARLEEARLAPGGTARFSLTLKAPAAVTNARPAFSLRTATGTPVADSAVAIPVHVVAAQAAQNTDRAIFNTTSVDVTQRDGAEQTMPAAAPAAAAAALRTATAGTDWRQALTDWSVRFFWAFLFFLAAALLLHIVYAAQVQHRRIVVPTLVVIGLATLLALTPLHFLQRVANIVVV